MSELLPIKKIFNFEKGSLQSTKCTPGAFTFVTAGTDWKTHNEFTHETEALILAVAASGSLGRCHYIKDKFIASDLCFILTPKDKKTYPIDLEFYHQIFRSIKNDLVQKTATGTSKLSINRTNFGNYKIPYFDIEHQKTFKKILLNVNDKKDKLLVCSDNQENLINILRNQIIQDAISGKLTTDWRKNNPDVEPASKFLEKMKVEKEKLIVEKKIKEEKTLSKILEDEVPFELPKGWIWNYFINISYIVRGGSPRPISDYLTDDSDGLNWIKIGDTAIGGKYIESTRQKIIKAGLHKTREVAPGDFLLTNSMSFGRPYISKIHGCIHDGWLLIRTSKKIINEDFLYYLLSSKYVFESFSELANGAVVRNLNIDKVKGTLLPIPPLIEQEAIVDKLEELMEQVSQLEEKIKQNNPPSHYMMA